MRIAQLNGAAYEAEQHAPIALREGVTRTVHVPDEVFAAVRSALDNRHLVELTATVGAYNMVSRFLEAMRIDARDDLAGTPKP